MRDGHFEASVLAGTKTAAVSFAVAELVLLLGLEGLPVVVVVLAVVWNADVTGGYGRAGAMPGGGCAVALEGILTIVDVEL